jgi:serine/threonine protein kinase
MNNKAVEQNPSLASVIGAANAGIGSVLLERYQIAGLLGQGGMSVAYKALDLHNDQLVALKFLLPDRLANPKDIARFKREAATASQLQHPGIVQVLDFGLLDDHQPYLVMEYVAGRSLAQRIESTGQLPVQETLDVFIQVCDALKYAHSKHVLHRDIKPSNIMVTQLDSSPVQAKLLDFGIAKLMRNPQVASQNLTESGEILGSPFYMSPEQARAANLDPRSDLYSLGCALYESLTGSPPHLGQTPLATILKRATDKPLTMSEASLGKTFPAQLETIVSKLLQTRPEDRYQSALALKSDLEKLDYAALSEADTPVTQPRERTKLRPAKALVVVCALIALLIPCLCWFPYSIRHSPENPLKQTAPPPQAVPQVTQEVTKATDDATFSFARAQVESAMAHYHAGKPKEADWLLQKALAKFEQMPSPDKEMGKMAIFEAKANNCVFMGQNAQAEKYYRSAIQMAGSNELSRATLTNGLAAAAARLGNFKQAYNLFQPVPAIFAKYYGDHSSEYCDSLTEAASFYLASQATDKARQTTIADTFLNKALAITEERYGSNSPALCRCLLEQAQLYVTDHFYAEADERCKRALSMHRLLGAGDCRVIGWVKASLAQSYMLDHKFDLAEKTYFDAIAILQKYCASNERKLADALDGLGDLYYDRAQWMESEDPKQYLLAAATYQRALDIYERISPQPLEYLISVHTNIGNSYVFANHCKYVKGNTLAEASFRHAIQLATGWQGKNPGGLAQLYVYLGRVCSGQRKYAEANSYFAQALTLYDRAPGPRASGIVSVFCAKALNLYYQKKLSEAVALYKRAVVLCDRLPKSEIPNNKFHALKGMGDTYLELGKYKEAETTYLEARRTIEHDPGPHRVKVERIEEALARSNAFRADFEKSSSKPDTTSDIHK